MMVTYKNPWYKPKNPTYGPEYYTTDAKPLEYKGFSIYERFIDICFDVVKDGTCISQRAGLNGAKRFIDSLEGTE